MTHFPTNIAKINLGKSSGIYFVGRLVPALLGFLTIPVFTKSLGVLGYGTFSLLMGVVSLLSILSTGWLESTFVRFVQGSDSKSKANLKSYLFLLLCSLTISVFIILISLKIFSGSLSYEFQRYSYATILAFIAISLFRPMMNYYRIFELPLKYTAGMISFSVLRFLLASVLLVFISATPDMIFYAYFIMGLIVAAFPFTAALSLIKKVLLNGSLIRPMVRFGLPYLPMLTATWVFSIFNRFAIDRVMGRESVGIYSAAFNLTDQSIGFLYLAIMMAIFPRLVRVFETGDLKSTKHVLEHGLSLYSIIILPAIVGFAILGKEILPLLSSQAFSPAAHLIPFLAINTGIVGLNQYISKPYELQKKTYRLMLIFIFGAVVNILVVFPLVKLFGLKGAVASNTISLSIICILLFFLSRKLLHFKIPITIVLKVSVAVVIMIISLWVFQQWIPAGLWGIVIKLFVGLTSYSIVGIWLGLHNIIFRRV